MVANRIEVYPPEKRQKMSYSIRLVLILMILFACQSLIAKPEEPERVGELDDFLARGNDIYYFGDSVLYYSYAYEPDHSTIPEFLMEALPGSNIGSFYNAAFQMDIYHAMCHYLISQGFRPKLIIIPINLRSFSPEWDQRPAYQFLEEKLFLLSPNDFIRNWAFILYRFNFFDNQILTSNEFDNTPIFFGKEKVGTIKTVRRDITLAFGSQYMYSLSPRHRRIKSMVGIAEMMQLNDTPVLFYITPINYEFGEKLIGASFDEQVKSNIALINGLLEEEGLTVLDLAYSLKDNYFKYSDCPDEHLLAEGRQYIAQQLSARIKMMLPVE